LNPNGNYKSRVYTLTSPNYPDAYPNNQDCRWNFEASSGKLKLVIDKFNIQWSSTCKTKDYLFVGQISSYTKVWLCGSSVPNDFSALVSKKKAMTVRFVSNGSGRKSGFKVRVIATS